MLSEFVVLLFTPACPAVVQWPLLRTELGVVPISAGQLASPSAFWPAEFQCSVPIPSPWPPTGASQSLSGSGPGEAWTPGLIPFGSAVPLSTTQRPGLLQGTGQQVLRHQSYCAPGLAQLVPTPLLPSPCGWGQRVPGSSHFPAETPGDLGESIGSVLL